MALPREHSRNHTSQVTTTRLTKLLRHTRGQVFLCSLAFIKRRLEIQKVKSTTNASKKIKTNHHKTFCTTHRHLSHPKLMCVLRVST